MWWLELSLLLLLLLSWKLPSLSFLSWKRIALHSTLEPSEHLWVPPSSFEFLLLFTILVLMCSSSFFFNLLLLTKGCSSSFELAIVVPQKPMCYSFSLVLGFMWECSSSFNPIAIAPKRLVFFLFLVLVLLLLQSCWCYSKEFHPLFDLGFLWWCSSSFDPIIVQKSFGLPPLVVLVLMRCCSSSFNLATVVPNSSIFFFLVLVFCGGAISSILHCYSKDLDLPPLLGLSVHEVMFIFL